jgi:hypothetical protein
VRNLIIASAAVAALLTSAMVPAFAEGQHNGWGGGDPDSITNGNGGNSNGNLSNEGTLTTYDPEGPKGQLKNEGSPCHNCSTPEPDLPGKNR